MSSFVVFSDSCMHTLMKCIPPYLEGSGIMPTSNVARLHYVIKERLNMMEEGRSIREVFLAILSLNC